MANVLFTWEVGGGLGHLTEIQPFAHALAKRGHQVVLALRDLSRAAPILAAPGIRFLQAPFKAKYSTRPYRPAQTLAHVLHNVGFENALELATRVGAWREIYDWVQPDLIVFDHSPTAMLAARDRPVRRAIVGCGFFCPVAPKLSASFRPDIRASAETLHRQERQVIATMNDVLIKLGGGPLESLAQLFTEVDETVLTTFPELDYYRDDRPEAKYWGVVPVTGGASPVWPAGDGPKIYCYLKPFKALPRLLAFLAQNRWPTLVVGDGLSERLRQQIQAPTLRIAEAPLDLQQVSRECDLAILNGGHGVMAAMFLAGKPMLHIPLLIEQAWNGKACIDLGIGLSARPTEPEKIIAKLQRLLHDGRFAQRAHTIAQRYAQFDPAEEISTWVARVDQLLAGVGSLPEIRPNRL